MATQEITREDWFPFFDAFSGMHKGWLVTVEVSGDTGTEVKAYEVPLEDIHADLGVSAGDDRIEVALGELDDGPISHIVDAPRHVRLREEEGGDSGALEIEAASGQTTFIRYKHLPLPKEVDGMFA